MYTAEMADSMIKKTLKSLCCRNGWCYGIFWGFDQRNSLLLTFKDAYYEEQMGALIGSMFLQAHVLGGGVIGQAAFIKNHRWMHSDLERQNALASLDDLEFLQEDSEFFYQFSMGIKTIAVISVEPWGVVQFGSTHKIPEANDFVDHVKELLAETEKLSALKISENEPHSASQFLDPSTQLDSVLSTSIANSVDQKLKNSNYSEDFTAGNHSLALPSQLFPSTSYHQSRNVIFPTVESPNQVESSSFFDCSANQSVFNNHTDCSMLACSWPSGFGDNMPFSKPMDYESCRNMQEFFHGSNFSVSKQSLEDDFSNWFSPQVNSAPFTTLLRTENLPTNSLQSSVTDAFRSCNEVKDSTLGVRYGRKKVTSCNETLVDALNFSTDISECISEKPKACTSNSLFSKLGLDQLLDGVASTRFEGQSSSAVKRRKLDNFCHDQVKLEGIDTKIKSLSPAYVTEAKNIELNSEEPMKELQSCGGNSFIIDGGKASSSRGQDEQAKMTKNKKAKAGTRPRPKDRQMIQDRLAELRELIPNCEKMSIDRLLERTIRHLNFMQSLTKHAESLKQIEKPKSVEVQKNHSSNGVTWACEVGDQTMVCPLIVEDLSTPGRMLIEMLCEDQGFFLEIVDVIRGFGLTIRKGLMEARETNKIWAHFTVEAEGNRCVSRHEIFSSLIQLLQMTGQGTVNASDSFAKVISSAMPEFSNFQPPSSFPVNFSALQCANL